MNRNIQIRKRKKRFYSKQDRRVERLMNPQIFLFFWLYLMRMDRTTNQELRGSRVYNKANNTNNTNLTHRSMDPIEQMLEPNRRVTMMNIECGR